MWNRNRKRRKAIQQSKIRKQFHSMGPFMEGFRTWRDVKPGEIAVCPYPKGSPDAKAWGAGVDFGAEREDQSEIRQDVSPESYLDPQEKETDSEERPGGCGSP